MPGLTLNNPAPVPAVHTHRKQASVSATILQAPRDGPVPHTILPSEFYDSFLSKLSKSRKPSPIRSLFAYENNPGMLSMLAGKPNPITFPFTSISMTVRSPNPQLDPEEKVLNLEGACLAEGLQYGMTSGMPSLNKWVTELASSVHGRSMDEGWRVSMGAGSQELLYKAFLALIDPEDSMLIEAPTYAGVVPVIETLNCNILAVASDADGLIPSSLEAVLNAWPAGKPMPKLLYTVPYGGNPTGATIPLERRKTVLALARKFNFLILEDDPYFHLYFGDAAAPASYFSLERSEGGEIGRVLRFDSFSKILAAGLRLGWSTGPSALLTAIELHGAAVTMQPSSTSQAMVYALLSSWGIPGFITHTHHVCAFYREKRDVFELGLEKHLRGIAEWTRPEAGMFFWVKLSLPASVDVQTLRSEEGDSSVLIRDRAIGQGVLVLPGESTFFDGRRTSYVRMSFSLLDEAGVDEGLRRLACIIRGAHEESAAAGSAA